MATYLYCVLTPAIAEAPPATLTGVGGAAVRALAVDRANSLEAWVSTIDEATLRLSGHALATQALLHNDVVAAALGTGRTPLPARFGSHFEDDESCTATLAVRASRLAAALSRVAGTVEMSVLIVPAKSSDNTPSPAIPESHEAAAGRRYLELVRERTRHIESERTTIESFARRIGEAVAGLARGEAQRRQAGQILSLAHLLRRDDVARYREVLRALPARNDFRIVVAGPRAPYSFVESTMLRTRHDSSSPNRDD